MSLPADRLAGPASPQLARTGLAGAAWGRPRARLRLAGATQIPVALRWLLPLLVFSAFLSGIGLLPLNTNVGPFEIVAVLFFGFFLVSPAASRRARLHPLSKLLLAIAIAAAVSQLGIGPDNTLAGFVQTMILINLFLVVTAFSNLIRHYRISPARLLTLVTYSTLIAGVWVISSGILSGGDIQASGPFRNRAHTGTYMLTAFWMVVIFLLLPSVRKRHRLVGLAAAATCLYAVAASGRRSAYLALFVGLLYLSVSFILARRGRRFPTFAMATFAVAFIAIFYVYGERLGPQGRFFHSRVGGVGERVAAFVKPGDDAGGFYALQREGVTHAFRERPLLGIGWGGFAGSIYSPTGHEVHSTPLRFLAELGIIGLALYVAFIGYLLMRSARLFLHMRRTPYSASYLALTVATWSLAVSYVYNRHITERTFWLFLAVFLTFDLLARTARLQSRRRAVAPRPAAPDRRQRRLVPGPAARGAGPLWRPRSTAGTTRRRLAPSPRGADRH